MSTARVGRSRFQPGDLAQGRRRAGFDLRRPAVIVAASAVMAGGALALAHYAPVPAGISLIASAKLQDVVLADPRIEPPPEPAAPVITAAENRAPSGPIQLASIDPEGKIRFTLPSAQEPAPPAAETGRPTASVPLPVPRPADLRAPGTAEPQAANPPVPDSQVAALPPPVEDKRNFLEKLLGIQPGPRPEAGTAIYDISARMVTMPNGETLEAHSGYGDKLDDPRFVHVSMRGATPPGTYELKEREKLFHGVRALRMNPVGGSAAVHNRVGLLAHRYMLGPRGDSNGCVSFRDYDKFLQAYLRGEVQRLVVVSGRGQDGVPPAPSRQIGTGERGSKGGSA